MNVFYNRKFDVHDHGNTHYALKLGYESSHTMASSAVPAGARVLDIGCGPGQFAEVLGTKCATVDGADQFAPVDASVFDEFFLWREGDILRANLRDYDVVLLLDFIEHLNDPAAFLDQLRQSASNIDGRPEFVVTTGNVVFGIVRLQALLGQFNYGKRGILD